jgi:hypothetical protein
MVIAARKVIQIRGGKTVTADTPTAPTIDSSPE